MHLDLTIQGEANNEYNERFFNEYYSNTLGMTSDTMPRMWVFTKTFSADFVGRRLDHPSSGLVRYGIES